jgi:hypothetical protein
VSEPPSAAARWWRATQRVAFVVVPVAAVAIALQVGLQDDSLAYDFRHELYPQAELLLRGENPYPPEGFDPTYGANLIWPPLAAFAVAPLTLLPVGAASVVMSLLGVACFLFALWLVGVRDRRVYGVSLLWPQVVGEMQLGHLTPLIALLVAGVWRSRGTTVPSGLLLGLAVGVKFLAWPLGVWLASLGRVRASALAATVALASLLLVLPYTSLDGYVGSVFRVSRAFDQASYTVFGLTTQAGASDVVGTLLTAALGAGLLLATWRYRSFTLAVASILALSPVVWLDYFALAAIPLALARPTLSLAWFFPLATWGMEGAGLLIGDASNTARLLVVFAVVLGIAFRAERSPDDRDRPGSYGLRRVHEGRSATRSGPSTSTS